MVTERPGRSPTLPGVFARGLAMGVAEIVPGVSGGTIAFVTGIYDELLRSLSSFSPDSLRTLRRCGWRSFVRRHGLLFLAVLGTGMATSFLLLARVVPTLMDSHGAYVSSFFFGLIAGCVVEIGAQSDARWLFTAGLLGAALSLAVGLFVAPVGGDGEAAAAAIFLAGALAAAAWLLPGVSGAFVLLLFGLYKPLLVAVNSVDVSFLATLLAGLVCGVLVFAKLLAWLLGRFRGVVMALLTGVVAGSLAALWPWRAVPEAAADASLVGIGAAMAVGALAVLTLTLAARRGGRRA